MWAEVKAGRPFILYNNIHCWVCDGVKAMPNTCYPDPNDDFTYLTFWHMNFGWDGDFNGYYEYGSINPPVNADLNSDINNIMEIHP